MNMAEMVIPDSPVNVVRIKKLCGPDKFVGFESNFPEASAFYGVNNRPIFPRKRSCCTYDREEQPPGFDGALKSRLGTIGDC